MGGKSWERCGEGKGRRVLSNQLGENFKAKMTQMRRGDGNRSRGWKKRTKKNQRKHMASEMLDE